LNRIADKIVAELEKLVEIEQSSYLIIIDNTKSIMEHLYAKLIKRLEVTP